MNLGGGGDTVIQSTVPSLAQRPSMGPSESLIRDEFAYFFFKSKQKVKGYYYLIMPILSSFSITSF